MCSSEMCYIRPIHNCGYIMCGTILLSSMPTSTMQSSIVAEGLADWQLPDQ